VCMGPTYSHVIQAFSHRLMDIDTDAHCNPIEGVGNALSLSLIDAIKYAQERDPAFAKTNLESHLAATEYFADDLGDTILSTDEVRIINLYTQDSPFYRILNARLRNRDRQLLKPYFPVLKLMVGALNKLPPIDQTVYRGVKLNLREKYVKKTGKSEIWWSFGSTTERMDVLTNEMFLGEKGERTIFVISSLTCRDISQYSAISTEKELLLLPGTVLVVESILPQGELTLVQLKEKIDPRLSILPSSNSTQVSIKVPEKPVSTKVPEKPVFIKVPEKPVSTKVHENPVLSKSTPPLYPVKVIPAFRVAQSQKVNEVKFKNAFTCVGCGRKWHYDDWKPQYDYDTYNSLLK